MNYPSVWFGTSFLVFRRSGFCVLLLSYDAESTTHSVWGPTVAGCGVDDIRRVRRRFTYGKKRKVPIRRLVGEGRHGGLRRDGDDAFFGESREGSAFGAKAPAHPTGHRSALFASRTRGPHDFLCNSSIPTAPGIPDLSLSMFAPRRSGGATSARERFSTVLTGPLSERPSLERKDTL